MSRQILKIRLGGKINHLGETQKTSKLLYELTFIGLKEWQDDTLQSSIC